MTLKGHCVTIMPFSTKLLGLNQDTENIKYRFAGFTVSSSQQVLSKNGKKEVINTKAYYLLMTFLHNHGQILTKDDLINAVWPGQIVTDTALTKQIVRLRKILGDTDSDNPIIETHRGVGYRFSLPVETTAIEGKSSRFQADKTPQSTQKKWLYSLIFIVPLLGYMYFSQDKKLADNSINAPTTSVNLALIQSSPAQEWYNNGSLDYLSELLNNRSSIHTINPKSEWLSETNKDKLAIEIASKGNFKYVCLIAVLKDDRHFTATLTLRNKDEIITQSQLSGKNISGLLAKINQWIETAVSVHENIKTYAAKDITSVDNYALESYLQGLFVQEVNSNQEKANAYFQAAVNKDENFIPAWVKLAESHVQLGHFKKAIAIGENLLQKFSAMLTNKYAIKIHYLMGVAYYQLRDSEKAKSQIRDSLAFVDESSNPFVKMTAYRSLSALSFLQQDMKMAKEYALERLTLAKEYYPFEGYLAEIHVSIAAIEVQLKNTEKAKDYLYAAMDYYEKANNNYGMIGALSRLNEINLHQNNLDEGVTLTQKATPYLATRDNPNYAVFFMSSSSIILNLRGLFRQADLYMKQMREIAAQLDNKLYSVFADFIRMHQYYVQNKFQKAKIYLDSIRPIFEIQKQAPSSRGVFITWDLIVSARAESAQTALKVYDNYSNNFPQVKKQYPNEFKRALGHIYVKSQQVVEGLKLLEEAEKGHLALNQIDIANYVGFEILEILLNHPEMDYKPTLLRVSARTKYDYLLYKLKAQFLAREGQYFDAALLMSENKQKANQLWKPEDQLLLEEFQRKSQ